MRIVNNNGHTLNGSGSGAIGFLNESVCTRQIGKYFVEGMRSLGHTVYDCTIDKSQSYLYEAVSMANKYSVNYAISHHLNCFSNSEANGVEVLIYDLNDKETFKVADRICKELSKLGLHNRGVKQGNHLYWLRKNNNKAILIEYLFCSNKKDCSIYNPQKLANAVIYALTNNYPIVSDNKLPIVNNTTPKTYSNGNYDCKGKVVRTNGEGLNIRAERNAKSKILGTLRENELVILDYCIDNWFSIWYNNEIGYINGKYIDLMK